MVYPAYLLCLVLMIPAFALTALVATIVLLAAGPRDGWAVTIDFLAFFGSGIAEPLKYGWRIVALLAVIGFVLVAGAIPALRTLAFHGLALMATLCAAFCLFEAAKQDGYNVFNALLILSPSFIGIAACLWFAVKFKT